MNKKYQYIILLAFVVIALWYGYTHKELFLNLKKISAFSLIALILLVFVSHILNGYRFKYLMRVFTTDLNFREWFGLSVCNSMFNYYLPARGGIAVRAYYLKKKHKFSYSHYTSLIAGSYIIIFFLSAGIGLVLTLLYKPIHGILYGKLVMIFSGLLLLTMIGTFLLVLFLKLGKRFKNERFNNILELVKEGLDFFQENRRLIISFSILHVAFISVMGARLFVCFSAIDIDVVPLQMLIISSLTTFSIVLSLTPANLGIKEGIISFSAHLLGIPADQAMLAALIDRGVAIVLTFLFGLIFSRILLSDMKFGKGTK